MLHFRLVTGYMYLPCNAALHWDLCTSKRGICLVIMRFSRFCLYGIGGSPWLSSADGEDVYAV